MKGILPESNIVVDYDYRQIINKEYDNDCIKWIEHLIDLGYSRNYFCLLLVKVIEQNHLDIADEILNYFNIPADGMTAKQRLSYYQLLGN